MRYAHILKHDAYAQHSADTFVTKSWADYWKKKQLGSSELANNASTGVINSKSSFDINKAHINAHRLHTIAGNEAMRNGNKGLAMQHMNKANYHYSNVNHMLPTVQFA